ncbi:MAG: hypothetical protein QY320_00360 [Gammaproteobacteria bacterium]|nr:MAG: hypothetical protein QY320_00360 [Gammaproteobacteria bacterium]
MQSRRTLRYWAGGWRALSGRDEIAGYRALPWHERLRHDAATAAAALLDGGFWKAALVFAAATLAAQILVWTLDLRGAARDAVQCLPVLIITPWVAAGRRRRLERRLAAPAAAIEEPVTVHDLPTLHSAASQTTEQRRWRRFSTTRQARDEASGSGGSMSCWWWPASACWRRWRCRASKA